MNHTKIWDRVQNCMAQDFAVSTADLPTYVCAHQSGKLGGNNIDFIRVFKKDKSHDHAIKSYRDLDGHQELVLFKGHIFKDGGLCLSNKCGTGFENDLTRKEVVCFPALS